MHDDVSVEDDEATEEKSSTNGQDKLKRLAPEEQLKIYILKKLIN